MDLPAPLEEPMLKDRKPPSIAEDHLQEQSQDLNAIPPQIPVPLLPSPEGSFLYGFFADPAARRRNIEEHIGVLDRAFEETTIGSLILVDAEQVKYQNFQDNPTRAILALVKPTADLSFEPPNHDFILFPSSSKGSSPVIRARIDNSSQCTASRLGRTPAESALSSIIPPEAEAPDRPNAILTTINRTLFDFHGIGAWMEVLAAIVPDTDEDADLHDNLSSLGQGAIP
ncbi:hypothetical protein B0J14DRAFT_580749 [Halenospora varia]|nr:hypothetical protein B0J14DRAFT_580749 [Halenospora varia]